MKRSRQAGLAVAAVILSLLVPLSRAAEPRVGVFQDGRTGDLTGALETLKLAGLESRVISQKDLQDPKLLADLDVLYFCGGWGGYFYTGKEGGRTVVNFVARGKGVFASAFRTGAVRSATRPLFPEVAESHHQTNANFVFAQGDHPVLAGFPKAFAHRGWDHLVMTKGPLGTTFLADVDGSPVGVAGEVYGGRYLALSLFLPMGKDAYTGPEQTLFLNCMRWLNGAKRLEGAALDQSILTAETAYLRRMRTMDYTWADRGADATCGVIPAAYYELRMRLEAPALRLRTLEERLAGEGKAQAGRTRGELEEALATLDQNYARLVQERLATIARMDHAALLADKADAIKAALPNQLLPDLTRETLPTEAARVIATLEPQARTVKTAQDAKEHQADLERVPALLQQAAALAPAARRAAALELGRIGDTAAAPQLVKLLADPDEQVQVNAIMALAWLQAKAAVPALLPLAQSDRDRLRRRAVQALGQIGAAEATPALQGLLAHADHHTAINAILALGWLRDPRAVAPLSAVLTSADAKDARQRDRACAAAVALGCSGQAEALPALKQMLAPETVKLWAPHYAGGLQESFGLPKYCELAVAALEGKTTAAPGIAQPYYLALRRHANGLRDDHNFFLGRPDLFVGQPPFKQDPTGLFDYATSVGANGFLMGWGSRTATEKQTPLGRADYLKTMGERDLRLIMDLPPAFGSVADKAGCETRVRLSGDGPALAGLWSEETYPWPSTTPESWTAWLSTTYGADWRTRLGLAADAPPAFPDLRSPQTPPRLAWAFKEYATTRIVADWQETQDWLHTRRKGLAFAFSITAPVEISEWPGLYAKAGGVIDLHGPESYGSRGPDLAFLMALARDGEWRPVLCEYYLWYCPTPRDAEQGFAMQLVHGAAFYNFYLAQLWPYPHVGGAGSAYPWLWDRGRWEAAQRVFVKARQLREYLGRGESVANVALVQSDRTQGLCYDALKFHVTARPRRYYQHQAALWTALQQAHLPTDAIWAETMTAAKLARYKVLVLADAKSLAPGEVALVRSWVQAGGTLIATGTTTLCNEWGEPQADYALADVFGVHYRGQVVPTDAAKVDSLCFVDSTTTSAPVINEKYDPALIGRYAHREVKPVAALGGFDVAKEAGAAALPTLPAGLHVEYDLALGYDRVETAGAEVLAKWPAGEPAVTRARSGKGACLFVTAPYPALGHRTSGWEMVPQNKDFWPGVVELIGGVVRGGLGLTGAKAPVWASAECPRQVEVVAWNQPAQRRWVIQFLDYDLKREQVAPFSLVLSLPAAERVRVHYPDTATVVNAAQKLNEIMLTTRPFRLHDLLVVEY